MNRICLAVALCFASNAFAHDTWLMPDRFSGACGAMTLHMTSGMNFPTLGTAIEPDRVSRAVEIVPGRRIMLTTPVAESQSLDFPITASGKGITLVTVDLAPKTLDLTPAEVTEYLDEIVASDDVRAQWKLHPGRWRETYAKHAKTFVRCDDKSAGDYQLDTRSAAEFVPQGTDPTLLKAGDTLKVILIENNKLIRDVPFVLVREGKGRVAVIRPGADGIASVIVQEPGRYMLSATHLRRGDGKDADWISDFTTLTFSVQ